MGMGNGTGVMPTMSMGGAKTTMTAPMSSGTMGPGMTTTNGAGSVGVGLVGVMMAVGGVVLVV